jgi:hypothetical protein
LRAQQQARDEAARRERERLAAEEAERQRLAAEEAERQRLAAEEAERQRLAEEEAERQRLAAEEAERQRIAAAEAARQARLARLQREAQERYDTAMAAWNAAHTKMESDTTNDNDCGAVSEDYRCGAEHNNQRCAWQNCSASGWCGTGDLFTGNANFNAIEGCFTETDLRIQREEWAHNNPQPVLETVTGRRRRLNKH